MSIAKNYIYNVVYQVFILIVPLITIPYVSRVLGAGGIGVNAYTNSIIQYFILIGTIGIALYGNRSIAYVRDDKEKLSRTFWSIQLLKLMTAAISYLLFCAFLLIVHVYQTIFLIQSIYIISAALDITWLFMGLEDFKKTVMRNMLVKVLGMVLIFIVVRTGSDLWKYVLVLALSEITGQLTLWLYLPKTVDRVRVRWNDIKRHIIPALSLFLPQIAIQIYAVLNKTMLGYMTNTNEVGYFDNADKIVKMTLAVVTAMGVVMLPRISNTFAHGEREKVKQYLNQSLEFASYLSMPMMFGIAGIAPEFAPWFFSRAFTQTGVLMTIISPIIVLIAWSNVLGVQYLLPTGNNRGFTLSVTAGAVVNFLLNIPLIHYYQSAGTAVATILSELTVTLIQVLYVRTSINFKECRTWLWKYLLAGLLTYAATRIIGKIMRDGFLVILLQTMAGSAIYFISLFFLRSKMNREIFSRTLQMIQRRRSR